jgi:ABC-2 type transport system ATP-binding protein
MNESFSQEEAAMDLLEAYQIRKSYQTKEVLKGISMNILKGETVAILGQNGAGKTTTIKIFASLLRHDSGKLLLFGQEPAKGKNQFDMRRKIGYVGQDSERSAYGRLTAEENLVFFGSLMGLEKKEIKRRINLLADDFQFGDKLNEQFMKLSGGQKQTMIIMRALLHDPELLFLDEPTKGLDPLKSRQIRSYLKKYIREQGKTLVLTSHIMPDVEFLADRIAFMRSGEIVLMDTPENACAQLAYSDVVEVKASQNADEIKEYLLAHTDIRILQDAFEGRLVMGTNNFFGVMDALRNSFDPDGKMEFLHRKASLEDAYLHFAQTGAGQSKGGNGNEA